MSAPAMNVSGLLEERTTARTSSLVFRSASTESSSARAEAVILFTDSPGRSNTTLATPPVTATVKVDIRSAALEDHGERHSPLSANGDQAELHIPPNHFVRQRDRQSRPGGAEGMADRDGT